MITWFDMDLEMLSNATEGRFNLTGHVVELPVHIWSYVPTKRVYGVRTPEARLVNLR